MLYGADAMSDMAQYWKNELKKTRRSFNDSNKSKTTTTVVKPSSKQNTKSVFDDSNVTSLNPGWGKLL
jgi:hypothetical protein